MSMDDADRRVSENLRSLANDIDQHLREVAGCRMGFSLVVFNGVPDSRLNYVSNCDRGEVVAALRSLLDGWEADMPDVPAHEYQS